MRRKVKRLIGLGAICFLSFMLIMGCAKKKEEEVTPPPPAVHEHGEAAAPEGAAPAEEAAPAVEGVEEEGAPEEPTAE